MYNPDNIPDCWKIVELTNVATGESHKRILCSWFGGYLDGGCWKLSSGNMSVEDHGEYYIVPQHSGSVYKLYKNSERVSGLMENFFNSFERKPQDIVTMNWSTL
jgi:hypothetical protein